MNRTFKNQNGEREADFINIVAWRQTAEIIAQYCGKGSQIGVTGRIQTRNYENQQGQRVYVTEVVAEHVDLLDSKNDSQSNFQNSQGQNVNNSYQNQNNGFNSNFNAQSMDISDSDLPF